MIIMIVILMIIMRIVMHEYQDCQHLMFEDVETQPTTFSRKHDDHHDDSHDDHA